MVMDNSYYPRQRPDGRWDVYDGDTPVVTNAPNEDHAYRIIGMIVEDEVAKLRDIWSVPQ